MHREMLYDVEYCIERYHFQILDPMLIENSFTIKVSKNGIDFTESFS